MFYLSLSVLLSLCGQTGSALLNLFAVCFALALIKPTNKISYPTAGILIISLFFLFLTFRFSLSFAYPVIAFIFIKKFKAISASDWYTSLALVYLAGFLLLFANPEYGIYLDRNYFSLVSLFVSLCIPPHLGRMVLPNVLRIALFAFTSLLLSRLFVIYLVLLLLLYAIARFAPSLVSKLLRISYRPNREFLLFMFANFAYCAMLAVFFQPAYFLDKGLSIESQVGPARLINFNDRSNNARFLSTLAYIDSVIKSPLGNLQPPESLDAYFENVNSDSTSDEEIINTPHLTLLAAFVSYGLIIGAIYIYLAFWLLDAIPQNKAFIIYAAYPAMFVLGGVLFGSIMPLYFLLAQQRTFLLSSCNKD